MNKSGLIACILAILTDRKNSLELDLAAIEESKNNDTKSSMGDKYETSREMAQAEWNKLQERKGQLVQQIHVLQQLNSSLKADSVALGSVVQTENLNLFFSIPFGKFNFENEIWMGVSLHSPIGQVFEGKKVGESVYFNNKTHLIQKIE